MSFVRQRIPYKRRGKERGTRETEVPAYQDERERASNLPVPSSQGRMQRQGWKHWIEREGSLYSGSIKETGALLGE